MRYILSFGTYKEINRIKSWAFKNSFPQSKWESQARNATEALTEILLQQADSPKNEQLDIKTH